MHNACQAAQLHLHDHPLPIAPADIRFAARNAFSK